MKSESKNLSIMITDIVGYSDKSSISSRSELLALLDEHACILKPIIEFYKGTIVKSLGDAFLCTFESATDSVVCAIIIQIYLQEYNEKHPDSSNLNIRIVINTGDVTVKDGDIFGDGVNIAARLESLSGMDGGMIGISESTYLLMNHNEIFAEEFGTFELKGVNRPVKVFTVPLEKQKLGKIPAKVQSSLFNKVGNLGEDKIENAKKSSESKTGTTDRLNSQEGKSGFSISKSKILQTIGIFLLLSAMLFSKELYYFYFTDRESLIDEFMDFDEAYAFLIMASITEIEGKEYLQAAFELPNEIYLQFLFDRENETEAEDVKIIDFTNTEVTFVDKRSGFTIAVPMTEVEGPAEYIAGEVDDLSEYVQIDFKGTLYQLLNFELGLPVFISPSLMSETIEIEESGDIEDILDTVMEELDCDYIINPYGDILVYPLEKRLK